MAYNRGNGRYCGSCCVQLVLDDTGKDPLRAFLGRIVGFWFSDYALGGIVALAGALVILNSGVAGSAVPFVL
jgi:hypothetical protein